MGTFAVAVEIELHSGVMDEFMPHMTRQAAASLEEPGCRAFEIWTDPARPDSVFLWEIYDNPQAFEAHLATPHFKAFDAAVAALVSGKQVATWANRAR